MGVTLALCKFDLKVIPVIAAQGNAHFEWELFLVNIGGYGKCYHCHKIEVCTFDWRLQLTLVHCKGKMQIAKPANQNVRSSRFNS